MEGGVLKAEGGSVNNDNLNSTGLMFLYDSTVQGGKLTAVGGNCGEDASSIGLVGDYIANPDLTITGGEVKAYTINQNNSSGWDVALRVPGVLRIEDGTVDAKAGNAMYESLGIEAGSVVVTGGTVTAKYGSRGMPGIGDLCAVKAKDTIEIGKDMGIFTGSDYQMPAYFGKSSKGATIVATKSGGSEAASPVRIGVKGPSLESVSDSTSFSKKKASLLEPKITSVNYRGSILKSWRDIQSALANLSIDKLKLTSDQKKSGGPLLLEVNIQNTAGYLPYSVVSGIKGKQNVGLHLFLGNGVAVTLLGQNLEESFKGTNLSNKIIITKGQQGNEEYIIDFQEKGKIGAELLLHASIPKGAKKMASIYKQDKDDNRTLLLNSMILENGAICFPIDTKEKYVIVY